MGSEPLVAFVVEEGAVSGEKILICAISCFGACEEINEKNAMLGADSPHSFGIEAEVFVG